MQATNSPSLSPSLSFSLSLSLPVLLFRPGMGAHARPHGNAGDFSTGSSPWLEVRVLQGPATGESQSCFCCVVLGSAAVRNRSKDLCARGSGWGKGKGSQRSSKNTSSGYHATDILDSTVAYLNKIFTHARIQTHARSLKLSRLKHTCNLKMHAENDYTPKVNMHAAYRIQLVFRLYRNRHVHTEFMFIAIVLRFDICCACMYLLCTNQEARTPLSAGGEERPSSSSSSKYNKLRASSPFPLAVSNSSRQNSFSFNRSSRSPPATLELGPANGTDGGGAAAKTSSRGATSAVS